MWPASPAHRHFANVACPSGPRCELPHCIFGHDITLPTTAESSPATKVTSLAQHSAINRQSVHDEAKQTLTNESVASVVPEGTFALTKMPNNSSASRVVVHTAPPTTLPRSVLRSVSPPTKTNTSNFTSKSDAPVSLMPRKLNKEPATLSKRFTLLKLLHTYMKPLNDKIATAVKLDIKALHLSPNQLIRIAVDEEEKIAKENESVYENILKQRLFKLKTMTPELWVKERREALAKERNDPPRKTPPKRVETGLDSDQEIAFLSLLKCPLTGLDAHGYVTRPPTMEELEEALKAHAAAHCWEECDRCNSRFQVFPERREEDGAFTTGGQCRYHWGKRSFAKRTKNAVPEPSRFTCCNEPVGSPGCTVHSTHVYNVKDPKRLSIVMPFLETPENEKAPPRSAVCFDCEMGYTTNGLELLRITAISWPSHRPLIDVLVRPLGHILDVNTRFSGITAEQFVNAKPYDPGNPKPVRSNLCIVDSPHAARELLLAHLSPTTPVLGHALENDLNTIRLIHPTIVDTVLLYPTRQGLPYRHGLRFLAKTHLSEDIQQGGAAGHDSFEDARTTGELIRFKIREKWKTLKVDGWQIRDGGVFPPMPTGIPPSEKLSAHSSMVPIATMAKLEGTAAQKRKFDKTEGLGSSQSPPAKK
ncbi:RNA exonuclease-like protein Rex3 [Pyrenochaeta sp. DS3sAY3a]|nr:RNA exonuclease-like protein Rex3 [Pyrenochaeta sp. DS3sAY3a]